MRKGIHYHHDQLTDIERTFVDTAFRSIYVIAGIHHVPLIGDDKIERAVDALARAVVESRPKAKVDEALRFLDERAEAPGELDGYERAHNASLLEENRLQTIRDEQDLQLIAEMESEDYYRSHGDIDPSLKAH